VSGRNAGGTSTVWAVRRPERISARIDPPLERAGLKFAGAQATVGKPGQVLWTLPAIGHWVPADTRVTIVVGVEAARIVLETSDAR
jgi:hypothetical protein